MLCCLGERPCSSQIQTGNRHFKRLLTLIRDLQKCEIPWTLTHPLSSHVWRTGPICSLEQRHRIDVTASFLTSVLEHRGSGAPN